MEAHLRKPPFQPSDTILIRVLFVLRTFLSFTVFSQLFFLICYYFSLQPHKI